MTESQLCNGLRGCAGGVHDLDALALCILMVDIVDAYAAADDELEPAGLTCRINDGDANLGCTPYNENVKILDLLCKFCGLIKLLNNFVTLCAKGCDSILFHTV